VNGLKTISTKDTHFSKRIAQEYQRSQEFLKNQENSLKALQEGQEINEEITKNTIISGLNNSPSRKKRLELAEKRKMIAEGTKGLFEGFVSDVIKESLLIDEDLLELNEEYIDGQIKGIVTELVNEGLLENLPKSITMKNVLEDAEYYSEALYNSRNEEDKIQELQEAFNEKTNTYKLYVSEVIKSKIASVVKNEQTSASLAESTELREQSDSLFKSLQVKNVKAILNLEGKEQIDEVVMESAFGETLVDYTILESLHTMKLVEFDTQVLRKEYKHFFK
jgi:hypothetical protein